MSRFPLLTFSLGLSLGLVNFSPQESKPGFTNEAGIDRDGNIYVASDEGKPLKMATVSHCLEAMSAEDRQTIGCSVPRQGTKPEETMQSGRLEIYLRNGKKQVIETETLVDWHFWLGGKQVALHSRLHDGEERYALYDVATARVIEELNTRSGETPIPQWAKNRGQLDDESVPIDDEHSRERTKWVAKVLRQIGTIRPGMKRQSLLKVFTTEGGLSTRLHRTYVSLECPYIQVNVQFRATNDGKNGPGEDPNDVIESISRPYLEWSVMD